MLPKLNHMDISANNASRPPPLHAVHPLDHLLEHADQVPISRAMKQLANRLNSDHMVNIADPGVKNTLEAGEFVALHIMEQEQIACRRWWRRNFGDRKSVV